MGNGDTVCIYICVYVRYMRPHFSSPGTHLCKMGGIYSQPML